MNKPVFRVINLKIIPNLITLLNLFFGCIAVVLALHEHLVASALLIILCSLLDFLDGAAARLLKAGSETGKQLDSLADLISFGFASAAIAYTYIAGSLAINGHTNGLTQYIPPVAFLITVFSAIRLAKFNTDTRQSDNFIGLPTPANALFFASLPLTLAFSDEQGIMHAILSFITSTPEYITSLVVVFSLLMVSPVRMFSLKFKNISWTDNKLTYIFLIISLCLIGLLGLGSLTAIMIAYLLISLITHVFF